MNWLRSLVQRNLPAKIIALLVATVLWFFVMNDQNPSIEGSFTVPIHVVNAPEGYKITRSEENVRIKVRGARSLFVAAGASDFKAYIDLNGLQEGKTAVKVQTVLPPGFELVETAPEIVTVTLDSIIQRKVKADLIVTGASAPGTTVAHINPAFQMVTIEGPSTAVETVTHVIGYVGLSNNGTDFSLNVPLTAVNADGREVDGVRLLPDSMEVSVQMARGLTKKVVSIKPIIGDDIMAGYALGNVRLDPSKIEIAGEENVIRALDSINTEKVSLSGITKTTKVTVKLDLPAGVIVTNRDIVMNLEILKK